MAAEARSDYAGAALKAAEQLSAQIQPLLRGVDSSIVGAVLADLTAIFIAGYHEMIREGTLDLWVATVRELVPGEVERLQPMRDALEAAVLSGEAPADPDLERRVWLDPATAWPFPGGRHG